MKRLPKSIRKFIRMEKARIRREVLSIEEQEKKIREIYEELPPKLRKKYENTKNEMKPFVLS